MSNETAHRCVLPNPARYKDVAACTCGRRYICIGHHEFPLVPNPIWKPTMITERWPHWLRWMG